MHSLRESLKNVPGLHRAVVSTRWLARLFRIWRSRNRQFLTCPPGHYYSPLPDYKDVDNLANWEPTTLPGLRLDEDAQIKLLQILAVHIRKEQFASHPRPESRFAVDNVFFSGVDAVVLSAMIRHFRPTRIIEVGAGHSTAVILDTCDAASNGAVAVTSIDPDLARVRSLLRPQDLERCRLIEKRVQDVELDEFAALRANDILFIDSTHVAKLGSDVTHLIFRVLPLLPEGVLIHFHDVFWPFEYPRHWYAWGWAWNEAYLLRAFLQHNDAFEILLFLSFLEQSHNDVLTSLSSAASRPETGQRMQASSLWLRKTLRNQG